jgi:hypothetical protein
VTAAHDQEQQQRRAACRRRSPRGSGTSAHPATASCRRRCCSARWTGRHDGRVGSNRVSDTLRPVTGQHNEPFRQQLGPAHPLSALKPGLSPGEPLERLGPYGRHWLVTFAVGEHAAERQVIKEANLFFALPALLALFPDSPVAVLTRSPLGVASGGRAIHWHGRYRTRPGTGLLMRWYLPRFMQKMASGLAAYAHQRSPDMTP